MVNRTVVNASSSIKTAITRLFGVYCTKIEADELKKGIRPKKCFFVLFILS